MSQLDRIRGRGTLEDLAAFRTRNPRYAHLASPAVEQQIRDRLAAVPATPPPGRTTTTTTPGDRLAVLPPEFQLWDQLNDLIQTRNRRDLASRIPGAEGLELQSSGIISQLLNPPTVFADVSRRAAEVGAGRGIPGSEAAFGAGLRMTDEERLRRMALGQQMLTGAYARNPTANMPDILQTVITPEEQAEIDARNRALRNQEEQTDISRGHFNLQRTVQGALGRPSDVAGNPVDPMTLIDPSQLRNRGMWVWG